MSVEETRARLQQRLLAALNESDVAWSTAQRAQLNQLASHLTDVALLEFDSILGAMLRSGRMPADEHEAPPAVVPATPAAAAAGGQGPLPPEEVLWQGRPFLSLGEHYLVTTQRVRIQKGLLGKDTEDIELIRIQDVDHSQGISERMLNIGDVFLRSADKSDPTAVLRNVTDPTQVHEIIRKAVMDARRMYPFAFRQEL